MKRVFSFVTIVCLAAGLALAQTGGDKSSLNPQPLPPGKKATTSTKTTTKSKKGHKTNAKSKKGSTSTTPPPK
ncbi:MAG TPA: hypothetical protein VJW20_10820 [Candidatus Angelobacter sp.]|nr:hypothetical protein [Candidatus Angelobacter sp.]